MKKTQRAPTELAKTKKRGGGVSGMCSKRVGVSGTKDMRNSRGIGG